jgi:antitoxin HicB
MSSLRRAARRRSGWNPLVRVVVRPAARRRWNLATVPRLHAHTVLLEPQPEGGSTVVVSALPGCVTEGETMEEAREMASDAIRADCESLLADGESLPPDVPEPPRDERLEVALARGE